MKKYKELLKVLEGTLPELEKFEDNFEVIGDIETNLIGEQLYSIVDKMGNLIFLLDYYSKDGYETSLLFNFDTERYYFIEPNGYKKEITCGFSCELKIYNDEFDMELVEDYLRYIFILGHIEHNGKEYYFKSNNGKCYEISSFDTIKVRDY